MLLTKLFIPATRPELVSRSHLIEQIDHGFHNKLTFISAPAGFGKTTLVTDWLDSLQSKAEKESPTKIAWFSLDEGDNDPTRFLTCLITALNRADENEVTLEESALTLLQSRQPPIEAILTSIIHERAAIPFEIVLVRDDYHVIESSPVND